MLYSTFALGRIQLAVPIHTVLEIVRATHFHPVRGAPELIDGLINLRGKVVAVINTGLAMGAARVEVSNESRIYIFKNSKELQEVSDEPVDPDTSADNLGLHVDAIGPVIDVDKDELQPVPANMANPFYQHVVRRNNDFIIILKPAKAVALA
jgi:purine-binding chemotaxis protein CheW